MCEPKRFLPFASARIDRIPLEAPWDRQRLGVDCNPSTLLLLVASSYILVVMPLLLVAMPLLLVASSYIRKGPDVEREPVHLEQRAREVMDSPTEAGWLWIVLLTWFTMVFPLDFSQGC